MWVDKKNTSGVKAVDNCKRAMSLNKRDPQRECEERFLPFPGCWKKNPGANIYSGIAFILSVLLAY